MPGRRFLALIVPLLAACDGAPRVDRFTETGRVIAFSGGDGGPATACFTCHGADGEGDGRLVPRLAGLDAGYLQRQLDDYVAGRREHAPMRAIARRLSLDDRAKVSAYYAGLPVPQASTRPSPISGARLYTAGDPGRGLAPCASCHGIAGEGVGAANPPLGAQPAAYLEAQLVAWRESRRVNDPLGEMRLISRRLAPVEIGAVAAHAAALPGAHPR